MLRTAHHLTITSAAILAACGPSDGGALGETARIDWAVQIGGAGRDRAETVTVDDAGRASVAVLHDEPLTVEGKVSPARGLPALALVQLEPSGRAELGLSIDPSPAEFYGTDLAADSVGNQYVAGLVAGGDLVLGDTVLRPSGGTGFDGVLVKSDRQGALRWAARYGGVASVELERVLVDPNDQVWAVGSYRGSFELGHTELPSADGFDAFAVRLSPTGTALEVQTVTGPGDTRMTAATVTDDGGLVMAGRFDGSVRIDGLEAGTGPAGVWLAHFDAQQRPVWLVTWPDVDLTVRALAERDGRLWVGGEFSGPFLRPPVSSRGASDGFLLRMATRTGEIEVAQPFGGDGDESISAIAIDGRDQAWVTGVFRGVLFAGDGDLDAGLSLAGFVLGFDEELRETTGLSFGSSGGAGAGARVAPGPGGSVVVAGGFTDSLQVGDATFTTRGRSDVVVFQLRTRR